MAQPNTGTELRSRARGAFVRLRVGHAPISATQYHYSRGVLLNILAVKPRSSEDALGSGQRMPIDCSAHICAAIPRTSSTAAADPNSWGRVPSAPNGADRESTVSLDRWGRGHDRAGHRYGCSPGPKPHSLSGTSDLSTRAISSRRENTPSLS